MRVSSRNEAKMIKYSIPLIALIGLVIGKIKFKNMTNPLSIFNFFWLILGILMPLGLFGVDKSSNYANLIILYGIVSFNIAGIIFSLLPNFRLSFGKNYSSRLKNIYSLNYKLLMYAIYLVLFVSFLNVITPIKMLLSGSNLSSIRDVYFNSTETTSLFKYYLEAIIIGPIRYIIIALAIVDQFIGKKKKSLIIASFVIVIFSALTSGGRFILVNSAMMLFFAFLISSRFTKIKFSQKIELIFGVGVLIMIIIYFTQDRSTTLNNNFDVFTKLLQTSYLYYAGSITYMGKLIEMFPNLSNSTFSANFFAGLLTPIFSLLSYLNILSYPAFLSVIGVFTGIQIKIGNNVFYNALPTIFMYFYIDAGLIGVVIGSMIFSITCIYIYLKMKVKKDILWFAIYLLIIIQLTNTSTRWFFYTSSYFLSFIYLRLFFFRTKVKGDV